jgi:hypothetical protein
MREWERMERLGPRPNLMFTIGLKGGAHPPGLKARVELIQKVSTKVLLPLSPGDSPPLFNTNSATLRRTLLARIVSGCTHPLSPHAMPVHPLCLVGRTRIVWTRSNPREGRAFGGRPGDALNHKGQRDRCNGRRCLYLVTGGVAHT